MSSLGIILTNIHNETIEELTRKRTSASIPFGGRYRLIDFTLSSFVNADINNIGVLTQRNYQSLMDHLGSGKDWDLSRKKGGLIIFPPYSSYRSDFLYENRFEALKSVYGFISKQTEDYVVLCDCDNVNVIDYADVIKFHKNNQADITVVYKKLTVDAGVASHMSLSMEKDGHVNKATIKSKLGEKSNVSLNVWVINRKLLERLLSDSMINGDKSFTKDIILGNIKTLKIYGYEYRGIYLHLSSMEDYFNGNMELLKNEVREELFGNPYRRIYTKVRDSAPSKYGENCNVVNSFISDGCIIEGEVKNSILSRGVYVGKGSKVENCILMQDTIVGANCELDHVITDKNVKILDKQELKGCSKVPYYLSKGSII